MHSYSSFFGSFTSDGSRYIEVLEFRFHQLLQLTIQRIYVDELWYKETYNDVAEAIREGVIASAHDHYVAAGYFEDRLPHRIVVDEKWYLAENPDVAEGVRGGEVASAAEHFQMAGFKEGRLPHAGWSLIGDDR